MMLISGGTGEPIGRPLKMPESKEIYISPVIHERRDGSQYILFGSGGETVGGKPSLTLLKVKRVGKNRSIKSTPSIFVLTTWNLKTT